MSHFGVPPVFDSLPRAGLDPARCDAVNAFLKNVKGHVRRAQTAFSLHADEVAILERLFYKGKNQHRSSLFWQRVSEMRRYGHRLQEMRICDLSEALRISFYGEKTTMSAKILKGAWTQYPTSSRFVYTLKQLRTCHHLIEKSQGRLRDIYHFFTLIMRDGAFMQLTLTMVAIASRLDQLLSQVDNIVECLHDECRQVFQMLHSKQALRTKPLTSSSIGKATPGVKSTTLALNEQLLDIEEDEDIGQSTDRTAASPPRFSGRNLSPVATVEDAAYVNLPQLGFVPDHGPHSLSMSIGNSNRTGQFTASAVTSSISVKKRKTPEDDDQKKPKSASVKTRKSKKSRDEIDDIFG